jgi:hypothetical protein
MAEQQHLEIVIELEGGADRDRVARWLQQHGLETMSLAVGVLAMGNGDAVRTAFGAEPRGSLPVPEALGGDVRSIAVVPPKRFHERT